MQRESILALTLVALAAVFLQGCGGGAAAPAAAPAPPAVSSTITAAVSKGTKVLEVANTVGFVANSKVTITDPATGASEANVISTIGSLNLISPLVNDYGVSTTVTMDSATAGTITSLAQVVTQQVVTAISPVHITEKTAATIQLTGGAAGDKLSFGKECNETTPSTVVALEPNSTAEVAITGLPIGVYDVCYQQSGKTDSIAQGSLTLTVAPATPANTITAIVPATSATSNVVEYQLTGVAEEGDQVALVLTGSTCPLPTETAAWTTITAGENATTSMTTPATAGTYELCMKTAIATSSPTKQTTAELVVKTHATCGDADGEGTDLTAAFACPAANTLAKNSVENVQLPGYEADVNSEVDIALCCDEKAKCGSGTTENECNAIDGYEYNSAQAEAFCSVSAGTDAAPQYCAIGSVADQGADFATCCQVQVTTTPAPTTTVLVVTTTPEATTTPEVTTTTDENATAASDERLYNADTEKNEQGSSSNVLFGAGGLMLVAFAVLGVKRAQSARTVTVYQDEDVNLEAPLE